METYIASLHQKIQALLRLAVLLLIVLILANVFVMQVLHGQIARVAKVKKTVRQLQAENESVVQTQSFLRGHESDIAQFNASLPNEESFITFVQRIEDIAQIFSAVHTLRFANSTPIAEGDYLYIPFNLQFSTTASQVSPFLQAFERIPNITHITSFEVKHTNTDDAVAVTINAKVYVQKPFSQ